MNFTRPLIGAVGLVLIALVIALGFGLTSYSELPVDPRWELAGTESPPSGAVTVRFSGTSTLLFSDGETHWMVDGWFSRPGPLRLLIGKIEPDRDAITRGLASNSVNTLAAVFPVHSHFDHAMDAPEVAMRTGARLIGSESTANIGRGWGLAEKQIQVVEDRESIQLGRFTLTPIESRHFQFPDPAIRERALANPAIRLPLVPPVNTFDYRLGKAYVLHVAHPLGSALVVGSAGYEEAALEGLVADVVFLGIGGLGSQTEDYREDYWRETVGRVDPERLIPIHFDSLTAPAEGPFRGELKALSSLAGGAENTLEFLRGKQAAHPRLQFHTLPRFDEVVLFEPGRPRRR